MATVRFETTDGHTEVFSEYDRVDTDFTRTRDSLVLILEDNGFRGSVVFSDEDMYRLADMLREIVPAGETDVQ